MKQFNLHLNKQDSNKLDKIKKQIQFLHSENSPFVGLISADTEWLFTKIIDWLAQVVNDEANLLSLNESKENNLKKNLLNLILEDDDQPPTPQALNYWRSILSDLMTQGYEIVFVVYNPSISLFEKVFDKKYFVFFEQLVDQVKIPVDFENIDSDTLEQINIGLDLMSADLLTDDIPDESEADILFQLGIIARFNGAYDKAIEYLEKAREYFAKADNVSMYGLVSSEIAYTYAIKGEPDKALTLFKQAYNLFRQSKQLHYQAKELINIGNILIDKGELEKAEQFYRQAQEILSQDPETQMISFINLSIIYAKKGKLDQALDYLYAALDIYNEQKFNDEETYLNILSNLSLVYGEQGKIDEAWKLLDKAFDIAEKLGDKQILIQIMNNFGILLHAKYEVDRALKQFFDALKVAEVLGLKPELSLIYYNIGLVYRDSAQYQQAIEYFEKGLQIDLENQNKEGIIASYTNLAEVYILISQYDKAKQMLDLAYKYAENSKFWLFYLDLILNYADYYSFTDQLSEAKKVLDEAKSMFNEVTSKEEEFKYKNSLAIYKAKSGNKVEAIELFKTNLAEADKFQFYVWKYRTAEYAKKLGIEINWKD